MRRREFITFVGSAVASPLVARAQQRPPVRRIAVLMTTAQSAQAEGYVSLDRAFEERLRELGYVNGKNVSLQNVFVAPQPKEIEDKLTEILPETDLLVVWSTVASVAAKKIAQSIPIVFLTVGVPLEIGLVSSLSKPGGNMTGVTFEAATETYGLRLQMLKEIVPHTKNVAVLKAKGDPNVVHAIKALGKAAPSLGIQLTQYEAKSSEDLPVLFQQMDGTAGGLVSIAGAFTFVNSTRIAQLTQQHRLPSCHGFRDTVVAGGLISLGPNMVAIAIQGANYVDKILRGEKPADLPVEQPTKMDVVINLKTAKALGLEIPPTLLGRADEVIE
jgi:putative tryptophan/tyrosine transport system substrate-binding protein